jgi:glycosyltransferase involved in cell wall biosynthesis
MALSISMELISVILPTRNGARYIEQSIDSCLNQTYANCELIIVDDGSTDDTPSKIARYTDDRIRVMRHTESRGLSAALNSGFSLARGGLLTWTSDDNYYRPIALERMSGFLRDHPDVDFVYADLDCIDDARGDPVRWGVRPVASLLDGNAIGACFLYRRRVHEVVGPYAEDIALAEDYDYWIRVSLSFRMAPLHENLYCYRLHPGSLSSLFPETVAAASCESLTRHLGAIPWADTRAKVLACMNGVWCAARDMRVADIIRYWALGFKVAPASSVLYWAAPYLTARLGRLTARRLSSLIRLVSVQQ